VELLKEIAPGVRRVAVLRDLTIGMDADEIERAVTAFAGSPNGGLIVTAGSSTAIHRDLRGVQEFLSAGA
jgi:hypothetical protein